MTLDFLVASRLLEPPAVCIEDASLSASTFRLVVKFEKLQCKSCVTWLHPTCFKRCDFYYESKYF